MRVTLYGRPGCHLCDAVRDELKALQKEIPHELVEVNIEADAALLERYLEIIPVVTVGPYTLRAPIDPKDLRVTLQAAQMSNAPATPRSSAERETAVRVNRGLLFFSRHWLAIFNLMVFVYVGLPFLAPVLMKAGAERQARWIYTAYSPLCHQWAFRSWFLFGPQVAYPRADAGTSLVSYGQATGLNENDLWEAREFLGNEQVGYKVALCERDVAIYGGIFLGGLVFALVRRRLRPMPLLLWLVLGILPIAIDGGTQLISSFPGFPGAVRESTPFLRTLTGLLFGLSNVWLAYPYVEESMHETRAVTAARVTRLPTGADPPTPPG